MSKLSPDAWEALTPVVRALERLEVDYYLGGSIASSAYGLARTTLDADLVAHLAPRHASPLVEALQSSYYIAPHAVSEAILRKSCFNVLHLPTMFKVDVFVLKDRPYDRAAMQRARKENLDVDEPSAEFRLASAEDVVLSKLEWFRLGNEVSQSQWRDVIGVLKVQGGSLDQKYLSQWAASLGIADLLERARREAGT